MKDRFLIAVVAGLFLLPLAVPQKAAACERCGPLGFVCNADYCDYIIGCVSVNVGHTGSNDCYSDLFGCATSGGFCQWASLIPPPESFPLQAPAPACHEAHS